MFGRVVGIGIHGRLLMNKQTHTPGPWIAAPIKRIQGEFAKEIKAITEEKKCCTNRQD